MLMVFAVFNLFGCSETPNKNNENEKVYKTLFSKNDYVQSTEKILNPDCGFYRPMNVKLTADGGTCSGINRDVSVQHLRINIGAFSKAVNGESDLLFTDKSLNYLNGVLENLLKNNKSAIVRFAYDGFNGVTDLEPSEEIVLKHIDQLCMVLNKFQDTITAIEVGMVGKWGEMHTSKLANLDTIDKLINHFLDETANFPILVRTPKMIYHYLGITINDIDNYTIENDSKAYRLGIFNDGYLGSSSDLGTYSDREKETNWLSAQTKHLPYGGEIMTGEMSNIENCLGEMFKMNLSYLNFEWNYNTTQDKWAKTFYSKELGNEELYFGKSAQDYIRNHLGYRFVVSSTTIKRQENSNNFCFDIKLKNIGFGNLTRKKSMKLLFVENETQKVKEFDVGEFFGGDISLNIPLDLAPGKYKVLLKIYNGTYQDLTRYEIAFSNENIFDSSLRANILGEIEF